MRISRVLLIDTAFAAVPIHDFLVQAGFDVWTIGNRAGDPLALAYPERWIQGDYSNVDFVRSLVGQLSIDAVLPGCTDVSMATFVATNFKGPYHCPKEVDEIMNKKDLFRQMCLELRLPTPRTVRYENLPGKGRFICKPVDSFSGRGATVFDAAHSSEAIEAFETARRHSPSSRAVCEDFVEGQLYSYSSFLKDGLVEVAFVVKEGARYNQFAVDTSYLVDWEGNVRLQILKESVEKMAAHLMLCDGLVHVQFISNENTLVLLEATRRCPGDLYSRLIEYSTGFPYAAKYASYFVGKTVSYKESVQRHILRHTIKQAGGSCFTGFDFDKDLNIFRVVPLRRVGEKIEGAGFQRTGLLFIEAGGEEEIRAQYERFVSGGGTV